MKVCTVENEGVEGVDVFFFLKCGLLYIVFPRGATARHIVACDELFKRLNCSVD